MFKVHKPESVLSWEIVAEFCCQFLMMMVIWLNAWNFQQCDASAAVAVLLLAAEAVHSSESMMLMMLVMTAMMCMLMS